MGRRVPNPTAPVVLIGFAEATAAIETAWSLRDAGFNVVAFRRPNARAPLRRIRGLTIYDIPAPEQSAGGAVGALKALVRRVHPAVVLPMDDYALWLCTCLDSGVQVAGPTRFGAECALDKAIQIDHAARAGLPVPDTQVVRSLRDAESIGSPVMVKSARAVYEADDKLVSPSGVVCADDRELQRASARSWLPPMLIQPLISGVGEGLFGHVGPRGVVAWSAHRRVRMVNPQGSTSSACRSQEVDCNLSSPASGFFERSDGAECSCSSFFEMERANRGSWSSMAGPGAVWRWRAVAASNTPRGRSPTPSSPGSILPLL